MTDAVHDPDARVTPPCHSSGIVASSTDADNQGGADGTGYGGDGGEHGLLGTAVRGAVVPGPAQADNDFRRFAAAYRVPAHARARVRARASGLLGGEIAGDERAA